MNLALHRSAIVALMVGLAALATPGAAQVQELPPAIQADRYLRQAIGHIEDGDGPAALAALDRIPTLEAEHGVEIPDAFWFRQAQAALAAEKADMAVEAVTRYLQLTLLEGEHYEPALDLLIEAEALQARFAPGSTFSDCDVCPQMVVVPARTFTMGSPESEAGRVAPGFQQVGESQYTVTIPAPFAVGVYEVTFAEWDACEGAGGCEGDDDRDGTRDWEGYGLRHPAWYVSWDDAQAYVSWLSARTGARYRLLSEAEWEYVARAGTQTARYWGESESGQCRYANGYDLRAQAEALISRDRVPAQCSDGFGDIAPVGSFAPNEFGLYDVLGNVEEWVQDCWYRTYVGAPPPEDGTASESEDCTLRVLRGGSWLDSPRYLRSAHRSVDGSDSRLGRKGIRVARSLN